MAAGRLDELLRRPVVLLDGGLGSMLIAAGLGPGEAPDGWNLAHPERVEAVHRAYVEAGSDIIHTNSFGASPPKLAAAGLAGRCGEVNAAAVAIARRAASGGALVAGDVGPTGLLLPPVGDATETDLEQAFAEQVQALAGVDLISVETMFDLREALAAVRAAVAAGMPVMACLTFEERRRGPFTIMGNPLAGSLTALVDAGALAVGCNCSVAPAVMLGMVREARAAVSVPVIAQPNAGQPRATDDGVTYDATPSEFAHHAVAMVEAGARIVGGCCGTTPEYIRAARAALGPGEVE